MQEYKTNLQNLHHETTSKFTQAIKSQMDKYATLQKKQKKLPSMEANPLDLIL